MYSHYWEHPGGINTVVNSEENHLRPSSTMFPAAEEMSIPVFQPHELPLGSGVGTVIQETEKKSSKCVCNILLLKLSSSSVDVHNTSLFNLGGRDEVGKIG